MKNGARLASTGSGRGFNSEGGIFGRGGYVWGELSPGGLSPVTHLYVSLAVTAT